MNQLNEPLSTTSVSKLIWLTDFGDLAVVLPMAIAIGIWLIWAQGTSLSIRWGATFCGSILTLWMLKVLFVANPVILGAISFHSPSGHAGISATVYGMVAMLIYIPSRGLIRPIGVMVMIGMIIGVTVSRIAIHAHSAPDALAGATIGLLWLIPMMISLKYRRLRISTHGPLVASLLVIAVAMHGTIFPVSRLNVVPTYQVPTTAT